MGFLLYYRVVPTTNPHQTTTTTNNLTQSAQQSWQLNWRWAGGAAVQVKAADGAVLISPGGGAGECSVVCVVRGVRREYRTNAAPDPRLYAAKSSQGAARRRG